METATVENLHDRLENLSTTVSNLSTAIQQGVDVIESASPSVQAQKRTLRVGTVAKEASLDKTNPTRVDDCDLPGEKEDMHLPFGIDGFHILSESVRVEEACFASLSERAYWRRWTLTTRTVDMLVAMFWWFLADIFKPNKPRCGAVKARLFSRISGGYVAQLMTPQEAHLHHAHAKHRLVHPSTSAKAPPSDLYISAYQEAVANAVFVSFHSAFPKSRHQFDTRFFHSIRKQIQKWQNGAQARNLDDIVQPAPTDDPATDVDATDPNSSIRDNTISHHPARVRKERLAENLRKAGDAHKQLIGLSTRSSFVHHVLASHALTDPDYQKPFNQKLMRKSILNRRVPPEDIGIGTRAEQSMSYREIADRIVNGEKKQDGSTSHRSNVFRIQKSPEESGQQETPQLKAHEQYARQRESLDALRKEHHAALRREMKELSDMQNHIIRKERKRFANFVAGWSENEEGKNLDVPSDAGATARDKQGQRYIPKRFGKLKSEGNILKDSRDVLARMVVSSSSNADLPSELRTTYDVINVNTSSDLLTLSGSEGALNILPELLHGSK